MNPTKTRIVLIGLGSRGDLQPYVGLALTLRQRGYRVKVYTYKSFSKYVASFGLDYYELDFDIEWEIRNNEHVLNALWKGDPFAFMEAVTKMQTPEWYRRLFVPLVADVAAFAPALVLTNFTAHWLSLNLAEMHGIPSCYTHLHPMVPSAQFPSMLWDAFGINTPCCGCHELGHLLQRKLVESGVAGASSGECVLRKTGLNLPAFGDGQVSAELARPAFPWLAVISAHLHPRPTDWEAHCQIVGPLVVPANETLSSTPPDPTLVSFLAAGPPPVYVGWGSMVCVSPEHMTTVACEGLMRAGARGVVLAGFAQLRHALLPPGTELAQYAAEHVYFGDDLAHEWLFPQCAMTVHHGGTGTTHAALRAGKPTIITPVLPTDQYTFARLVHERGVGVPLPHLRKVTPHMLASAITLASSERMVAAAAELGRRMSAEDGNAECVRHLEIYLEEKVFNGAWRADFQARWLDLA